MKTRVVSWVLLAAVVYGAYVGVKHWKNPWSTAGTAGISAVLPPAHDGCGKGCL